MSERDARQDALDRAKRILAELEKQAAGYTALTRPPHLVIEIKEKRDEIERLQGLLKKGKRLGVHSGAIPPPHLPTTADADSTNVDIRALSALVLFIVTALLTIILSNNTILNTIINFLADRPTSWIVNKDETNPVINLNQAISLIKCFLYPTFMIATFLLVKHRKRIVNLFTEESAK